MNRKRIVLIAAGLVMVLLGAYLVLRKGNDRGVLEASGTVEATEAALGFRVPGQIERVVPNEGDRVEGGTELAWLSRAQLLSRRAQAEAQVAAVRAVLREMEAGSRSEEVAQAVQAFRAADERLTDAQRDYTRMKTLWEGGAVSTEAYEKAKTAFEVATAQRDQAVEQRKLVETGPRPERIAAQKAAVAMAEAGWHQAEEALDDAVIVAPFSGVVTVRDREPGEVVGAGVPVITLMNLADRWVRIYIREDRIGAVRIGQLATITADTYPDKQYSGVVSFISSEAEFTPRNVQTAEERIKLVYAVKVRITGDPANDLKPGMPADVRLEMGPASGQRE